MKSRYFSVNSPFFFSSADLWGRSHAGLFNSAVIHEICMHILPVSLKSSDTLALGEPEASPLVCFLPLCHPPRRLSFLLNGDSQFQSKRICDVDILCFCGCEMTSCLLFLCMVSFWRPCRFLRHASCYQFKPPSENKLAFMKSGAWIWLLPKLAFTHIPDVRAALADMHTRGTDLLSESQVSQAGAPMTPSKYVG